MEKQKVLITGGAGYIGSVMTPFLLQNGFAVTVLDNLMYPQPTLLESCAHSDFNFIKGDVCNQALIQELLPKFDIIIPLAAIVGAPACNANPILSQFINQDAITFIAKNASSQQKVIFPTTNSGYGIGEKGKFCTEETPLRPISHYGRHKVEAEKALLDSGKAITLRLATVFGLSPRMRVDLLVNDFVYRAVTDRALVIFEGHFKRNYIHIRDVARVFLHAIQNFDKMKNQPYNVGLDEANLSKLELCVEIKKQVPGFVYLEAPIGEDPDKRDYIVSNQKLLSTGFKTEWTLQKGITELIKGYSILKVKNFNNV